MKVKLTVLLATALWISGCHTMMNSTNENTNDKTVRSIDVNDRLQTPSFSLIDNDPAVSTGMLSNGLTYYIRPNSKPEHRVELRLVVKAGSVDEDVDQLGLAHFIEHMAFNGTKHFEKNELVDYLESVGSKFGPDLNAYTSFDETVYMLQVRSDDESQLRKGLLVLSDWAAGQIFDPEEVEKERGVVLSEWRSGLSADQRMRNEYLPVLLRGSRYAGRLPIGDPEIVRNADISTIKRYYYNWYRPDLMAVVVVGDVDVNLMEDYIHEYFDKVPVAVNPRKKGRYSIPEHDETLVKVCSDPEAAFTRVQVVYKLDEQKVKDIGDFIQQMTDHLAVSMLKARMAELTQKADAPYLYSMAHKGGYIGPSDAFELFAVAKQGGALEALEAMMTEVRRAQLYGFTEGELQRAKDQLMKMAEVALNEKDKTESRNHATRLIQHFLRKEPYPSAENYHYLVQKYLQVIQLDRVQHRFNSWNTESNRVIIITGPDKEGLAIPVESDVIQTLKRVDEVSLEAYVDHLDPGPLVDYEQSEVSIVKHEVVPISQIEVCTLGNGAKIYFKPTDFSNDQILFRAFSLGGNSMFADEDYWSVYTSSDIVEQSGLGRFTSVDLTKKLAGKDVHLYPYIGTYSHGLRGNCAVEDVQTLADLIYLNFTEVREDSSGFESVVQRNRQIYGNLDADPRYFFGDTCQKILYMNHLRRRYPTLDELEKIDMNTALNAYRECFSGPDNFRFVFVGNVSDSVKSIIINSLGKIPSSDEVFEPRDVGIQYSPGKQETWNKGSALKTFVQISYHGASELNEENRMGLVGLRELLNIKLREVLREDKGGVYGVGVRLSMDKFPRRECLLSISFNCQPEEADDLIAEVYTVLKSIVYEKIDPDDMAKITEIQRQSFVKGFHENVFWLTQIYNTLLEEGDIQKITKEEKERLLTLMSAANIQTEGKVLILQGDKVQMVQNPE